MTTTALDIKQDIQAIQDSAHQQARRSTQELSPAASLGDVLRQGDLYLVLIPKPKDGELTAIVRIGNGVQLAPGQTQGSRHVLEFGAGATDCGCWTAKNPSAVAAEIKKHNGSVVPVELIGPVFATGSAAAEITHPEHGHFVVPAETTCVVTYQRQHAEEVRRVND